MDQNKRQKQFTFNIVETEHVVLAADLFNGIWSVLLRPGELFVFPEAFL